MIKILVADDEPDLETLIRQKFRQKIREQVYAFVFAQNGQVALDKILEENQNSYIASVLMVEDAIGIAYADVSTGAFFVMQLDGEEAQTQLLDELARIQPREVICNPAMMLKLLRDLGFSRIFYRDHPTCGRGRGIYAAGTPEMEESLMARLGAPWRDLQAPSSVTELVLES